MIPDFSTIPFQPNRSSQDGLPEWEGAYEAETGNKVDNLEWD